MGIGGVLVGIGGIGALLRMKHPSLSAKMNRNLKGRRMAAFIKKGIGAGGTYRYYNTKKCFSMACHAQAALAVRFSRILQTTSFSLYLRISCCACDGMDMGRFGRVREVGNGVGGGS